VDRCYDGSKHTIVPSIVSQGHPAYSVASHRQPQIQFCIAELAGQSRVTVQDLLISPQRSGHMWMAHGDVAGDDVQWLDWWGEWGAELAIDGAIAGFGVAGEPPLDRPKPAPQANSGDSRSVA
jgi:hypothetical protein